MYTVENYRTKKELKEAFKSGTKIDTYQPGGMFPATKDGQIYLEGPHYPKPHTWYAMATVRDGIVTEIK